ncbi:MAG: sugar phosphate isomerase/epimerase, partial [Actinobacteria bacterium]|nr:sugar phosphate isomerase/epimerase [Actinomycetota bacterium]
DLAHSYTNGDPVEFLRSMNFSYIGHIHLSDSKPGKVHVPLGEGEIDLFSLYEAIVELGYEGIVNIEGYEPGRGTDLIVSNKRVIDRLTRGGNSPGHAPG